MLFTPMPTVASYPGPRSKCLGMRLTLAAPLKPRHTIKVIPYTRESRLALARNALMTSAHSFPIRLLRSLQKEKLACVCSQDLVPGLTIHQCVWIASFPGSGEESGNETTYFIESLGLAAGLCRVNLHELLDVVTVLHAVQQGHETLATNTIVGKAAERDHSLIPRSHTSTILPPWNETKKVR